MNNKSLQQLNILTYYNIFIVKRGHSECALLFIVVMNVFYIIFEVKKKIGIFTNSIQIINI